MSNTWLDIRLDTLADNLRSLQSQVETGTQVIAVVKSDAYGHGMLPVARTAWDCGVRWFAVTALEEALPLRAQHPEAQIIIVGVLQPSQVAAAIDQALLPVVIDSAHAAALSGAAGSRTLRCHAKIDTGMGRLGFGWERAAADLEAAARLPGLDLCGICSHFASADDPDVDFAAIQFERFGSVLAACEQRGLTFAFKHIANSGGLLQNSAWHIDGIRPGILLYGYPPETRGQGSGVRGQERNQEPSFRPFLEWRTRVVQIKRVPPGTPISYGSTHVTERETCVGTLDVGYADGYARLLSNCGIVLVHGRRRPVIGRVTMNLTMVDLGPESTAQPGDEAVLLGIQGEESIWADELANLCGTISYEILTRIRTADRRITQC